MSKQELIKARNKILKELGRACPSWQPNRMRALQVEAHRLASEIGKAAQAAPAREIEMKKYCKDAVNREIRRDPRIKGKEAKAIHRLLKGRH